MGHTELTFGINPNYFRANIYAILFVDLVDASTIRDCCENLVVVIFCFPNNNYNRLAVLFFLCLLTIKKHVSLWPLASR